MIKTAIVVSSLGVLVACGSSGEGSGAGGTGDASTGGQEAGSGGGSDAGPPGSLDAGGPDLDSGTTVRVIQPVSGTPVKTGAALQGPGVVLMGGGTDVDAAFVWMHDTIAGSRTARFGNVVVLRSDNDADNAYTSYIYGLAPFQSVMTVYVGGYALNNLPEAGDLAPPTAADLAIAAWYVDQADIVFFAGGDQADYVTWKGSPLVAAVQALYARGGAVGGTSAGCAILGHFVYDSIAADQASFASVQTADAVANPYEGPISFTHDMLAFSNLPNVLTDTHFVARDRMGRLAAFVARQYADGTATSGVVGVGVDQSNALLVDKSGKATLAQQPGGTEADAGTGVYVVEPAGPATTCASGKPLVYPNLNVTRLSNPATDSFDFTRGCGSGVSFKLAVDGTNAAAPYAPAAPYAAAGSNVKCP